MPVEADEPRPVQPVGDRPRRGEPEHHVNLPQAAIGPPQGGSWPALAAGSPGDEGGRRRRKEHHGRDGQSGSRQPRRRVGNRSDGAALGDHQCGRDRQNQDDLHRASPRGRGVRDRTGETLHSILITGLDALKACLRASPGVRQDFRAVGPAYLIENDVLLITTSDMAEERLTTRIYPVGDLVGCHDEADRPWIVRIAGFVSEGRSKIAPQVIAGDTSGPPVPPSRRDG